MLLLLLLAVGLAVALTVVGAPRGTLSRQAEVLVDDELAADRVGGSAEGEANDDGEGVQLRRDLLELSESLRDGVAGLVLLGNGSQHARRLPEHPENSGGTHLDEWGGSVRGPEEVIQLDSDSECSGILGQ